MHAYNDYSVYDKLIMFFIHIINTCIKVIVNQFIGKKNQLCKISLFYQVLFRSMMKCSTIMLKYDNFFKRDERYKKEKDY